MRLLLSVYLLGDDLCCLRQVGSQIPRETEKGNGIFFFEEPSATPYDYTHTCREVEYTLRVLRQCLCDLQCCTVDSLKWLFSFLHEFPQGDRPKINRAAR